MKLKILRKFALDTLKYITYASLFLFSIFLFREINSQSLDKDSSLIRYYSNKKKFTEAKNVLTNSSIYSESSPQYELLETEIWIEEAEFNYKNGNFKTSYDLFLKASNRWSTHPLVRDRLAEMKHKILKDNKEIVKTRYTPLSKTEGKEDNSYQWSLYNQELFDLKISLQNQEKKYWNLLFLFSCSTLMMLFLLFITVKTNRKEN
jgi:HD superfamily phosphohydrolase